MAQRREIAEDAWLLSSQLLGLWKEILLDTIWVIAIKALLRVF